LRIDDLDTPRNVKGADTAILHCLERFGLLWDGPVYYQRQHQADYLNALNQLQADLYACRCSRKQLADTTRYPGFCREAHWPDSSDSALRLTTDAVPIVFSDALQGTISQNLAQQQGDFIVRRKDQIIAYQFAVVIDDHAQHINHVMRGADLLDSTPKQIYLQQRLGYPTPRYLHLPLIVDRQGNKLSKQTLAAPVDDTQPATTLFLLLQLLQQQPPADLLDAPIDQQLQWAVAHWQPQALKKIRAIRAPIH